MIFRLAEIVFLFCCKRFFVWRRMISAFQQSVSFCLTNLRNNHLQTISQTKDFQLLFLQDCIRKRNQSLTTWIETLI